MEIAVVGAGFIGCSTALHLSETLGNCSVTMISKELSPFTTSDKATALILPFEVTKDPLSDAIEGEGNIATWSESCIKRMKHLYESVDPSETGITISYGYWAMDSKIAVTPWWAELAIGFRDVSQDEARRVGISDCYKAYFFGMYALDPKIYLPWLMKQFKANGGIIVQQEVSNLSLLNSYDFVINCTGLDSYFLADDKNLMPMRGDLISMKAPWVQHFVIYHETDSFVNVNPRVNDVILGGVAIPDEWSTEKDHDAICADILKRCTEAIPSLAYGEILTTWSGLRPVRNKIRCDYEADSEDPVIIHCYGHGSKGASLHWGCAEQVQRMVSMRIRTKFKSKL